MSPPVEDTMGETRDDVFGAPSLIELFCRRTAEDFQARARQEVPGLPWVGVVVSMVLAAVFWLTHQSILARLFVVLLILQILWTVWALVVRSGSQIRQQAEDVARGRFPPESAPLVVARLRWWNHLVSPRRWARHSRVHGRRQKLERKIEDARARIEELKKIPDTKAAAARPPPSLPPHLRNRVAVGERLQNAQRQTEELPRLQEELQVYEALLEQTAELVGKLARIEKLVITVREGTQTDLAQMVTDALTILEERRALIREVDEVDPEEFINMITV